MAEASEFHQLESTGSSFHPLYEWIPDRFPIPFIVKLIFSLLLGFLFLAPHYVIIGDKILRDWSWLLALIIVTAMICLYYATHTFRAMFPQMDLRLQSDDQAVIDEAYFGQVRRYLNNKRFFWTGLLVAVLNCAVGWGLEIPPPESVWAIATTYLGFFLAGFVCGMAMCGIRGVVITLNDYIDHQPKVEYTNPDGCGGLLFFGEALVKFSAVTLIVGLLIALYILEVEWASRELPLQPPATLLRAMMWLWIAFPFLLSLTILLAPASRANQALMNHKIQKEVELALALDKARADLHQAKTDSEKREKIRHDIEYYAALRAQLHRMRVWPFDTQTNIKFVVLFVGNAIVAIESIRKLLENG